MLKRFLARLSGHTKQTDYLIQVWTRVPISEERCNRRVILHILYKITHPNRSL